MDNTLDIHFVIMEKFILATPGSSTEGTHKVLHKAIINSYSELINLQKVEDRDRDL